MARQYKFLETLEALPAGAGKDWLFDGLELFKKRPILLIGTTLAFFIIFLALGIIPFIGAIASIILTPILSFGILNIVDGIEHDDDIGFGTLFSGFTDNPGRALKFGLVYLGLLAVSILGVIAISFAIGLMTSVLSGGSALVGALGITVVMLLVFLVQCTLMLMFWLAMPIVLHNDEIGFWDALKLSFQVLTINWLPILVYNIVALIFIIIATITVVGILVIFPVLICTTQAAYRQMLTQQ